jgi:hypothetical protein
VTDPSAGLTKDWPIDNGTSASLEAVLQHSGRESWALAVAVDRERGQILCAFGSRKDFCLEGKV